MTQLILEPTAQAQWQTLVQEAQSACDHQLDETVQEAQSACDHQLDETLESYLVFLLMRFASRPQCTARIMAEDYLRSQALQGEQRASSLRDVGDHCLIFSGLFPQLAERRLGDHCLIFSGLFPQLAERRLVRISYFVAIGQSSYRQLSDVLDRSWAAVYQRLSEAFIMLMDILQAMRETGGQSILTPLQAMDLWQDTGSRRCYQQVCDEGNLVPFPATPEKH